MISISRDRLEKKASSTAIAKSGELVSETRQTRNVVSTFGHFSCFLLETIAIGALVAAVHCFDGRLGEAARTAVEFFSPATKAFLYPLVQTICSHRLRNSFTEMMQMTPSGTASPMV